MRLITPPDHPGVISFRAKKPNNLDRLCGDHPDHPYKALFGPSASPPTPTPSLCSPKWMGRGDRGDHQTQLPVEHEEKAITPPGDRGVIGVITAGGAR